MTDPRSEDDEPTRPIDKPEPEQEATAPIERLPQEPAEPEASPSTEPEATARFDPLRDEPDTTAPFDPFTDEAPEPKPRIDETVLHEPAHDATRVIPPAEAAPPWAGRAGVPVPPPPRDAAPYSTAEPPPPRTWWTPVLLGLLALGLLGVVVLVAWLMNRDPAPEPTVTPTATVTAAPTPSAAPTTASPTPSPTPTIQLVQLPAGLVGMSQNDAVAELTKLGLGYSFEFQDSAAPEDEVIATRPAGQELVPAGSSVTLVISKGGLSSPTPSPTATPTANP